MIRHSQNIYRFKNGAAYDIVRNDAVFANSLRMQWWYIVLARLIACNAVNYKSCCKLIRYRFADTFEKYKKYLQKWATLFFAASINYFSSSFAMTIISNLISVYVCVCEDIAKFAFYYYYKLDNTWGKFVIVYKAFVWNSTRYYFRRYCNYHWKDQSSIIPRFSLEFCEKSQRDQQPHFDNSIKCLISPYITHPFGSSLIMHVSKCFFFFLKSTVNIYLYKKNRSFDNWAA